MKSVWSKITIILLLLGVPAAVWSQTYSNLNNHLVEVSGAVLSSDSSQVVSNAVISVFNQNRGVMANEAGIFSLVCQPGDTLVFNSIGYQSSHFVIPQDYVGKFLNHIQLMTQDTFYLSETVIHGLPTGRAFVYAFKFWPTQPNLVLRAKNRFSDRQVSMLRATLPMSGPENQTYQQQQQAIDGMYYGQIRSGLGILSPLAWNKFFQAWKRGDFRNKKY